MKIHQYNEMMRYLTRKKDNLSVEEKKKILDDHYKPKPMPITEYIQTMNRLYGNGDVEPHTESDDPRYLSPEDKKDILQSIPVSPLVKKKEGATPPKKKKKQNIEVADWKNSTLYQMLNDPRIVGTELSFETISEIMNLIQHSGLVKKEPEEKIDHIALLANGEEFI